MSFEEVARLAQQKGFFFKSAETYPNSPAGFMEYGPLGLALRNNVVELWRRAVVKRGKMMEIDGSQILPRGVFEASGHLSNFNDPFVRCSKCGSVFRPDKLIEDKTKKPVPEKLQDADYDSLMEKSGVRCLKCGSKLSGTSRFNMMFRVGIGPSQEEAYLRPETAQSIFIDFPYLFKTQRVRLPFGVAQFGRSFRNEIAPRQALIRMRELNQAEVEIFFNPKRAGDPSLEGGMSEKVSFFTPEGKTLIMTLEEGVRAGIVPNKLIAHYLSVILNFFILAGLPKEKIRFRVLSESDRAFYSKAAYDLEIELSVGWLELVACNYRSDYDLGGHSKVSGSDFSVVDDGEKVLPHVFELSTGIDRTVYAILESSMRTDGDRKVLGLRPYLAPVKAGVFPLVNKDGLEELATESAAMMEDSVDVSYDDSGSIGRRYARADEVGTPFCVTIDYDSLKDKSATLRHRDSKEQERVQLASLPEKLVFLTKFPSIRQ